jgi:hypothetical protein
MTLATERIDRQMKGEIGLGETPARVSGARHIANVSAQLRNVCNSVPSRGQRSSGRLECAAYLNRKLVYDLWKWKRIDRR